MGNVKINTKFEYVVLCLTKTKKVNISKFFVNKNANTFSTRLVRRRQIYYLFSYKAEEKFVSIKTGFSEYPVPTQYFRISRVSAEMLIKFKIKLILKLRK